jgi:DNA-binding CsgD family transcriptional regulator
LGASPDPGGLGEARLTAREGQILRLLVPGLTNKEISRLLVISERTVKFHVSHILAKFAIEDRRGLRPWDQPRGHFFNRVSTAAPSRIESDSQAGVDEIAFEHPPHAMASRGSAMGEAPGETREMARIRRRCVIWRAGRVLIEQYADQIPQIAADEVAD